MIYNNRKIPAKRITVYAVYQKFTLIGESGRAFCVAFPSRCNAEKWVREQEEKEPWTKSGSKYMVEEFTGTMKSWQP